MNVFILLLIFFLSIFCLIKYAEMDDEKEARISAIEFLLILQDVIRTFLNFINTDRQTRCEKFRYMIKKKSAAADQTMVNFLKKINHKASHHQFPIMCLFFPDL